MRFKTTVCVLGHSRILHDARTGDVRLTTAIGELKRRGGQIVM